jgi:hypothetical protein
MTRPGVKLAKSLPFSSIKDRLSDVKNKTWAWARWVVLKWVYNIYAPWCWYIYLQNLGDFVRAHVGKYSSTMEHIWVIHTHIYIYI